MTSYRSVLSKVDKSLLEAARGCVCMVFHCEYFLEKGRE